MTREEKIAELINIRDNFNYTLAPREVFDDAIKALEQEPRNGMRWIGRFETHEWGKEEWFECPWCHMDSAEAYNFCPNCGTDFREVGE